MPSASMPGSGPRAPALPDGVWRRLAGAAAAPARWVMALLLLAGGAAIGAEPLVARVAPLPYFYEAAVSIVVIRPTAGTLARLAPLLGDRERGIRATFHLDGGGAGEESMASAVREARRWGHELGIHVAAGSRAAPAPVEGRFTSSGDAPAAGSSAHVRSDLAGPVPTVPDPDAVPMVVEDDPTPERLAALLDGMIARRSWSVVAVPGERVPDEAWDEIMHRHDRLWDAPVVEVLRYRQEALAARVEVSATDPDRIMVSVADGLDDEAYDLPLTMAIARPRDWSGFSAHQAGAEVWHGLIAGELRFQGVPDRGPVVLTRTR